MVQLPKGILGPGGSPEGRERRAGGGSFQSLRLKKKKKFKDMILMLWSLTSWAVKIYKLELHIQRQGLLLQQLEEAGSLERK